ncbi:MAG: Ig-like domain-containing protein [Prevotella sp.]|nr:Ig-like domain-containing protein [Prevotella sp.]
MKKAMRFLMMMAIALTSASVTTSCSDDDETVTLSKFTIDPTATTLTPGETLNVNVQFFPENVEDKTVEWTSSDNEVATVANGVVTAIKPGSATITATPAAMPSLAKTLSVSVTAKAMTVSGEVSGTWDAYTTVTVSGQLKVPAGKSLTIEEGVEVIFNSADANGTGIEFTVDGNIYCKGTADAPILFSVPTNERKFSNVTDCKNLWGGFMLNSSDAQAEALFENCIIEYAGSAMTENSPSVISGIYTAGEDYGVQITTGPEFQGSLVVTGCVIRNGFADGIYMQGGQAIITNNTFSGNGATGGEAVNVKAGTSTVVAYNVMYSPNTNGLKLSSSGQDDAAGRGQAKCVAYNNTIINAGWRRDGTKGGCIYVEKNILVNVFNNLMVNCKYRAQVPKWGTPGISDGCDDKSVIDYNCYAASAITSTLQQDIDDETTVPYLNYVSNKNYADAIDAHSVIAKGANDLGVAFANYALDTNRLDNAVYDEAWDFTAKSLPEGATDGASLTGIVKTSLTVGGKTYAADAPQKFFGARK